MSDLSDKFAALQANDNSIGDEAHSQRVTIISTLDDIQTAVANINANMLLMKSQLLAAQAQADPCMTCPPPSLITPPTDTTANPIDEDKCKRVQALMHAVSEIAGVIGGVTNSAIVWSPSIVTSGINEVITTLITGGTVPLPSFGEAVNIAGDAINYALSNIGRGDDLQAQFNSLGTDMQSALFAAASPGDAQAAYDGSIDGSTLPGDEKLLLKVLGFNALFTYFLDPTSTPDLTPYSGTVCTFPSGVCFTISTVHSVSTPSGFTDEAVSGTFGPFTPITGAITTSSGAETFTPSIFYTLDPFGWTMEALVGHCQIQYRAGGQTDSGFFTTGTLFGVDGTPHALPHAGSWVIVGDVGGSIRICKL